MLFEKKSLKFEIFEDQIDIKSDNFFRICPLSVGIPYAKVSLVKTTICFAGLISFNIWEILELKAFHSLQDQLENDHIAKRIDQGSC